MSDKLLNNESRFSAVKNEATRQRWELFHTAIALAKQSNAEAMEQASKAEPGAPRDTSEVLRQRPEPLLSIAR